MSATLIARMRAQRQSWVNVAPGKRIQIIRPHESALGEFLAPGSGNGLQADLAHVVKYTTDWEGITEADLLGATVGAADAIPFNAELWAETCADRTDWIRAVAAQLLDAIVAHQQAKADAAKN